MHLERPKVNWIAMYCSLVRQYQVEKAGEKMARAIWKGIKEVHQACIVERCSKDSAQALWEGLGNVSQNVSVLRLMQ